MKDFEVAVKMADSTVVPSVTFYLYGGWRSKA